MPKRFFRFFSLCIGITALIFTLSLKVEAIEISEELLSKFGADRLIELLPEEALDRAEAIGLSDMSLGEVLTLSPSAFIKLIKSEAKSSVYEYKRLMMSLLGLIMLFAAGKMALEGDFWEQMTGLVSAVFSVFLLCGTMTSVIADAGETVLGAARFLVGYVPIYAAVTAAAGKTSTAVLYHTSVIVAAEAVSAVASKALVPLGCVYLNLCIAEGLATDVLPKWSSAIKKAVNWLLVLSVTAFAGLLSLQSTLTGAADSAGTKTVKLLAGTFIPVIGSAMGDAVQAAQGSIKIIRTAIGSFGIAATVVIMAPVLMKILFLRLGFGFSAALADVFSLSRLSSVIKAMGHLLSVLTATVLAMALLIVISTAVIISAGGAAL